MVGAAIKIVNTTDIIVDIRMFMACDTAGKFYYGRVLWGLYYDMTKTVALCYDIPQTSYTISITDIQSHGSRYVNVLCHYASTTLIWKQLTLYVCKAHEICTNFHASLLNTQIYHALNISSQYG